MKKIKKLFWSVLNSLGLGGMVELQISGALKENGWFRSFHTKRSVDKAGNPIPWVTYPFMNFIDERLHKGLTVFEYGCGNSTKWYAKRVNTVTAVEHDKVWVSIVEKELPANARVIYRDIADAEAYEAEILRHNHFFNIVIVDGRKRVKCAEVAINRLSQDGILVFDNSNLENYKAAMHLLKQKGFRKLDFWGMSPITSHQNCTTIFYRPENCLGI